MKETLSLIKDALFKPEPVSKAWLKALLFVLLATFVFLFVIIRAGLAKAGIPNYYFGEGRIGTLVSLVYLLFSSGICFAICRKLLVGVTLSSNWKKDRS